MYLALFLSPWVLMYALSTLAMNHRMGRPPVFEKEREQAWTADIPPNTPPREIGRRILADLQMDPATISAGLLHDVGGGLFMQHYPRDYAEITLPSSEGTPEALAREEEKFGQSHPELAYTMAVQWRLSELVSLGLRHHHTPLGALPTGLLPDARGLIQVLQLADDHARRSGYSFGDADRLDPAQPRPELGLQPGEAEVLVGDLQKTIEELESLYLGLEKAPGVEVKTPDHQRS